MRVIKTPAPTETKLNLAAVRVELYQADQAAEPPGHARVIVTVPGAPDAVRHDMPLSDVLNEKQLSALEGFRQAFIGAALAREGFVEAPEDAAELSDAVAPGE